MILCPHLTLRRLLLLAFLMLPLPAAVAVLLHFGDPQWCRAIFIYQAYVKAKTPAETAALVDPTCLDIRKRPDRENINPLPSASFLSEPAKYVLTMQPSTTNIWSDGVWRAYGQYGELISEIRYAHGKLHGKCRGWGHHTVARAILESSDDWVPVYWESTFDAGLPQGYAYVRYGGKGGPVRSYDPRPVFSIEGSFANGERSGTWTFRDRDNNLISEEFFDSDGQMWLKLGP